jgi:formate dehydrogenase iron-sulfur subunit
MTMEPAKQFALLFDLTRCAGCYACVEACMKKQGFPGDPEKVERLSATAYTVVKPVKSPDGEDFSYRNLCRHCVDPTCVSVCPVTALTKSPEGPVVYDPDKCMGCRYCMTACPFSIPRYEWDDPVPRVRKCDMCHDRLVQGLPTACAEACPNEATVFGTREELLADARSRIEEEPDSYYPHIYGEHEVGGTNVLFLSPFPIEDLLGFKPSLGADPLRMNAWRVLSKVPSIAIFAAGTMGSLWWLTRRRDEVRAWEAAQRREPDPDQNGHDRSRRES